jgi:hypothetical protein
VKKCVVLVSAAALAACISGCGDNKTKEKIVNGGSISGVGTSAATAAATPASYSGNVAVNSAGMISRMGSGMGKAGVFAPALSGARVAGLVAVGDGFYQYADLGSDFRVKFMNAAGDTLDPSSAQMATVAKLEVKIRSLYEFGTFNGDFFIDVALNSSMETVTAGTITSSDPVGGTLTAVITPGMLLEKTQTAAGTAIFVPHAGVMTISSTSGYTGTNTFTKDGAAFVCTGPINYNGSKVADVSLTWDSAFGNYTGHYIDTSTGESHDIRAK